MRKILCSLALAAGISSGAIADGIDITGIITGVDNANKTITINGTLVQILPQTRVKLDDCGIFGMDLNGKFTDLVPNSFVEAEVFPNMAATAGQYATPNAGTSGAPIYIAEEVELKCTNNRAY